MKVAIYMGYHGSDKGGVFTYATALIKTLTGNLEISSIILIYSPDQKLQALSISNQSDKVKLCETRIKNRFISRHLWNLSMALLTFRNTSDQIPIFFEKLAQVINPFNYFINRIKCDIIHIPFQFSPFYKVNKPLVITLHDLQEYHFPEFFSVQTRIDRAIRYKMAIDYANIIVSFKHVKEDIIKYFNVKDPERIKVCSILGTSWVINTNPVEVNVLKDKFGIEGFYILYPAQTWRHKNHINLIKSLKILKDEGLNINLVCTGSITDYYIEIEREIEKLQLSDNVRFLGLVTIEELNRLYLNARLVVIPTLYEAGSGPLYEAMSFNAPVICSNVTSLPETIGDTMFVFNPLDINEIAEKIKCGFIEDNFREKNCENSKKRVGELSLLDYSVPFIEAYKLFIKRYNSKPSNSINSK